ncbi:Oligopeptide-binding protein oppA [Borrelia hermsii YBT]|nr:Oligopeptide-binding protein oppA [Borrelia hermsii YBT]
MLVYGKHIFIIFFIMALSCSKESRKELMSFKICWGAKPKSIDPQLAEDVFGFNIIVQMFSGIMDVDAQTGGLLTNKHNHKEIT